MDNNATLTDAPKPTLHPEVQRLILYLIRPAGYDDEGYANAGRCYWYLFNYYFSTRNACELGEHPLSTGFYRFRDRIERRPLFSVEGRLTHTCRRTRDLCRQIRVWGRLLLEMQDVWLGTQKAHAWKDVERTREDLTAFWKRLKRMRANPLKTPVNAAREFILMKRFLSRWKEGISTLCAGEGETLCDRRGKNQEGSL